MSINNESTGKLTAILDGVEPKLADDVFQQFYILNPLQFAKLLHSLSLPDAMKSQLLALKVNMPPNYTRPDLQPLIEKLQPFIETAMRNMWQQLVEESGAKVNR